MKKTKIVACLLAAALPLSLTVHPAAADQTSTDLSETSLTDIFRTTTSANKETKDETVYVMTDAAGSIKQIIVSDWIKNGDNAATLNDQSTLTDIENVKGDETYTVGSSNAMSWAADGSDIYYRGNATAQLPVSVTVSYKLDGQSISAADLEGKSGKVTIHYEYQNNEKRTVEIDGKQEDVYVPFVMATGALLNTENFTNVEVTNGKVLNDSNHIAVMGFALPGMKESLGVTEDTDLLPESVEITADVTDFSLANTVTIAMPLSMDNIDLSGVDSFDDLKDQIDTLVDGSQALVDGTSELYDGLNTLLDKSGELVSGVDELASGAETLKAGAVTLSSGMDTLNSSTAQLAAGTATLDSGAQQLASGASTLAGKSGELATGAGTLASGASDVANGASSLASGAGTLASGASSLSTGVSTVSSSASQISAGSSQLASSVNDLNTGASQLSTGLNEVSSNSSAMNAGATAVFNSMLANATTQVNVKLKGSGMSVSLTIENYDSELGKINESTVRTFATTKAKASLIAGGATEAQAELLLKTPTVQQSIEDSVTLTMTDLTSLKASLDSYNTFYQGLQKYTAGVDKAAAGASQIATGAAGLAKGAGKLAAGTGAMASGADSLSQGAAQVSAGANSVSMGAGALSAGASQVSDGASTLASGASALATGASTLADKISEMASGTATLSSNMQKLSAATVQLDNGAAQLTDGLGTLSDGIGTLQSSTPALVDGVQQLTDGAGEVKDGMQKLNDEGIQKIADLTKGDLATVVTHLRALADVAGDYNNYSGINSDAMDGTVKFIYKTDAIGDQ